MGTKAPLTVTAAMSRVIDYRLRENRISLTEAASKVGIGRDTFRRRIEGASGFNIAELERVAGLLDTSVLELTRQAEDLASSSRSRAEVA